MPQFWINNKIAVEVEELVPRFWSSYPCLKVEIYRYKDKPYGIKRLQIGGNGRKMLIDYDSLHFDIKNALGDLRKSDHFMEKYYKVDTGTTLFYQEFVRENGSSLTSDEQDRYIVNATMLQALINLKEARIAERRSKNNNSTSGLAKGLLADLESFENTLLTKFKSQHNIPKALPRFKEALNKFENFGLISVIKDVKGSGKQNALKVVTPVSKLLNGLFAKQKTKPNPTDIYRVYTSFLSGYTDLYCPESGEIYNPKDYPSLSQATITNHINAWYNAIGNTRGRTGNRQQYIGKYIPHAIMDWNEYASTMISIDDRQPPFWYEKGKRMWFYIGLDTASDCITTFVYGKTKEGLIIDFYRQMVRNYAEWGFGLPLELECESSLNSTYKDTLLKEGNMFEYVKMEANNARGKTIERRFGKIRYGMERKIEGFIGRPFAKSEANQSGPGLNTIIPYNNLTELQLGVIEDWNNQPCGNPILKKQGIECNRFEYFLNNQNPKIKPINYRSILPTIGYVTKSSCQGAYIKLQNQKRAIAQNGAICTGDLLIAKMKQIEGKELTIYWLDNNEGDVLKALAYYKDEFVCEVMTMPTFKRGKAEQTDACKIAIDLQSRYTMTIEGYARSQYKAIEKVAHIDNTPKPERIYKIERLERYQAHEPADAIIVEDDEETEYSYAEREYKATTLAEIM